MTEVEQEFDVIIIGGGCSGLSAAYHIKKCKSDTKILILEAKDRLGGRVCGSSLHTTHGKDSWDVGGQWVASSQPNVIELINELGLQTYEQDVTGKKLLKLDQGSPTLYNDTTTYGMSLIGALDIYFGLKKFETYCHMVPTDDPLKCPYADEWDKKTLSDAIDNLLWTHEARKMLSVATHVAFGVEPSEISFFFFLYFCQMCGGIGQIIDTERKGYAQEWKVKGGAFRIVEKLADYIGLENIKFSAPVASISQDESSVAVQLLSGEVYRAKNVIIAIPPIYKAKIHYNPPLPNRHRFLYERMPVGHLTKVIVTYPKRFWKEQGLSGESIHWPLYEGSEAYPACLTFDATSSSGSPALVIFVGGKRAIDLGKMRSEDQCQNIINSLILLFGSSADHPIDIKIKDWSKESWNGGCPVAIMSPGGLTLYGNKALKEPFQRLHWAGTETADCWPGYIDGAVQSGIRAAEELLCIDEERPGVVPTSSYRSIYEQQNIYFAQDRESTRKWLLKTILIFGAAALVSGMVSNRLKINIPWHWR